MSGITLLYRLRLDYTLPMRPDEGKGPYMDRVDALSDSLMALAADEDRAVHGDATAASPSYLIVEGESWPRLNGLARRLRDAITNAEGLVQSCQ